MVGVYNDWCTGCPDKNGFHPVKTSDGILSNKTAELSRKLDELRNELSYLKRKSGKSRRPPGSVHALFQG